MTAKKKQRSILKRKNYFLAYLNIKLMQKYMAMQEIKNESQGTIKK